VGVGLRDVADSNVGLRSKDERSLSSAAVRVAPAAAARIDNLDDASQLWLEHSFDLPDQARRRSASFFRYNVVGRRPEERATLSLFVAGERSQGFSSATTMPSLLQCLMILIAALTVTSTAAQPEPIVLQNFTKLSSNGTGGFAPILMESDSFGAAVCFLGDLDGDGVGDAGLAATRIATEVRKVAHSTYAFLNANGSVKRTQKISSTQGNFTGPLINGDFFGSSCSLVGSGITPSGGPVIAVGAPRDSTNGAMRGALWLLELDYASGNVIYELKIADGTAGLPAGLLNNQDFFGSSVSGFARSQAAPPILAVGTPGDDHTPNANSGALYMLRLHVGNLTVQGWYKVNEDPGKIPTGTLRSEWRFGSSITSLGMNTTGSSMASPLDLALAVGAPGCTDGGSAAGAVFVVFFNPDVTVKAVQKIPLFF
jgi:hypothetical protein